MTKKIAVKTDQNDVTVAQWRRRAAFARARVQIFSSTNERKIPFYMTCEFCGHTCAYYRRIKWNYNRCNCPVCDHEGVVIGLASYDTQNRRSKCVLQEDGVWSEH